MLDKPVTPMPMPLRDHRGRLLGCAAVLLFSAALWLGIVTAAAAAWDWLVALL
ncbi:MAG TPA: hypothetical protein VMU06_12945 [Stellaceae bacterium]|nr:hypothetical protein [Stellaceae bacterium]